jgi:outer membrane autotransporter protein
MMPSLRVDYTRVNDDSYRETGAGVFNLDVNSRSAESLVLGIDDKFTHKLNDRTTLTANVGIGYDTINQMADITTAFTGAPDLYFTTYGIDQSPWLINGGVGAVYKINTNLEIAGRYDTEYRDSLFNQSASLKVRLAF